jgi:hypothetical protein
LLKLIKKKRTKTLKVQLFDDDECVKSIREHCTHYSAMLLINAYRISLDANYLLEPINETSTNVLTTLNKYQVKDINMPVLRCTCYNFNTFMLPCKHIFYVRRMQNINNNNEMDNTSKQPIFLAEMVPTRCKKATMESNKQATGTNSFLTVVNLNSPATHRNLNR